MISFHTASLVKVLYLSISVIIILITTFTFTKFNPMEAILQLQPHLDIKSISYLSPKPIIFLHQNFLSLTRSRVTMCSSSSPTPSFSIGYFWFQFLNIFFFSKIDFNYMCWHFLMNFCDTFLKASTKLTHLNESRYHPTDSIFFVWISHWGVMHIIDQLCIQTFR